MSVAGAGSPSRLDRCCAGPATAPYYLDAVFEEWRVVVEVDGIQHAWAQNVIGDALRQNDVSLQNATVLRLPLLGLRVAADEFFAQIEQALRDHGWPGRPGDVMRSGRRGDRSA